LRAPGKYLPHFWLNAISSGLNFGKDTSLYSQSRFCRNHHEQKVDAVSKSPEADDKAYNAALKSLPNKPYDPWLGTR
jgi:hypothetical protein